MLDTMPLRFSRAPCCYAPIFFAIIDVSLICCFRHAAFTLTLIDYEEAPMPPMLTDMPCRR